MLYIRRLFNQDIKKQITANKEGSKVFFQYDYSVSPADRTIYFTYKDRGLFPLLDGSKFNGILHPDSSEARINGDFKGFIMSQLGAAIDDIILIWNNDKDITKYTLSIVKTYEPGYAAYIALLGSGNHCVSIIKEEEILENVPLQQIFYGAPGTGKSHSIGEQFVLTPENTFRTTFHPDTDYASFVGCYKPYMKTKGNGLDNGNLDYDDLLELLKQYNSKGNTYKVFTEFGFDYYNSLDKNRGRIKDLVSTVLCKGTSSFSDDVYIKAGMSLYEEKMAKNQDFISYTFRPQVFISAYIKAWSLLSEKKPVFLVIDEINRGNCAQIFGDLFQLLDRNGNGYSDYEIRPDKDIEDYISKNGKLNVCGVTNKYGDDISDKINNGELLKLPKNLYIIATMNTSDQSLFPMDSAFKRRWTWKYTKIEDAEKEEDKMFLELEDDEKNIVKPWIEVITTINTYIKKKLRSSDKQIGYWFVKSDCKVELTDAAGTITERNGISIAQFRDKVLFFLFDDAFKDDEDFASLFGSEDYLFVDLFGEDNMKAKVMDILNKMKS